MPTSWRFHLDNQPPTQSVDAYSAAWKYPPSHSIWVFLDFTTEASQTLSQITSPLSTRYPQIWSHSSLCYCLIPCIAPDDNSIVLVMKALKVRFLRFWSSSCCLVLVVVMVYLLSYLWLLWPMDCGLPGSAVHGIFQARILEWIAVSNYVNLTSLSFTFLTCKIEIIILLMRIK